MTIKVGDRIPSMTLVKATSGGPQPVETDDYFAGRKIALFSVPGAFTPTCSARHLPGFVERADELKAKGVDEIACTAVNDAFVLAAWAKSAGAEDKVTMLADGNPADLWEAKGEALWKQPRGPKNARSGSTNTRYRSASSPRNCRPQTDVSLSFLRSVPRLMPSTCAIPRVVVASKPWLKNSSAAARRI